VRADRNLAAGTNLQGHATTGRRVTGLVTAVAPPAVAQKTSFNYGAPPATIPYLSPVTSGSLLIAAVGHDAFGTTTVHDSQSNVWSAAVTNSIPAFFGVDIWWAKAGASGPDTLTVSATFGAQVVGQVYEVTGISSSTPVDQTGTSGSTSVAPVVGPNLSGLAGATDFVIYWAFYGVQDSTPVGGIWTSDFSATISGSHFVGAAYADTGPTVTGPTFVNGASAPFVMTAAAFHP
jgi:hypothetical protein